LDSWDLTKLVARRWRISLPMFLATVVLSVLAATAVKPTYVYTAYVQLVPPMPGVTNPGQEAPVEPNPWVGQGLSTIGNAALISVQNLSYLKALKAQGYSSKITAQMGGSNPLATFTITGATRAQAASTANQVAAQFDANVTSLQTGLGLADTDLITARRLDRGTNLAVSNSRVKRAVIAVAGLGLIMTITLTIAADALLRRRDRRAALEAASAANDPAGSVGVAGRGTVRARGTARPGGAAIVGLDSDVASGSDDSVAPTAASWPIAGNRAETLRATARPVDAAPTVAASSAADNPSSVGRATAKPVASTPTVAMPTADDERCGAGPITTNSTPAKPATEPTVDETVVMAKPVAVTEE
jgi:hypothetical protein